MRAIKFLTEGLSKRQALIRAGYSLSSANQATRIIDSRSMGILVGAFQEKLLDEGLDSKFFAEKMKDWSDSKVPLVEIAAYDRWKTIMEL